MRTVAVAFLLFLTSGASLAQVGLPFPGPGTVHGAGGPATYSVITTAKGGTVDTNNVTSGSFDSSGGDLIVVAVSSYSGGTVPTGVSDNKGNTFTGLTAKTQISQHLRLWYKQAPAVGSGHTISTTGGSGDYPAMAVVVLSGSVASPFDLEGSDGCDTCSSTFSVTSPITPSVNNALVVMAVSFNVGATMSIDSSFTIDATNGQVSYTGGGPEGVALAYKIQTTATAEQPNWTASVAQNNMATVGATFKP